MGLHAFTLRYLILLLAIHSVPLSSATSRPPLIVFGDSYLDTGASRFLNITGPVTALPYGIDFIPGSGRFSNGKVLTDLIASALGAPSPPVFFSGPKDLSSGVNMAVGGAGILNSTNLVKTVPLLEQLSLFEGFLMKINVEKQSLRNFQVLVDIGTNDFLAYFSSPGSFPPLPDYISLLVSTYINFIKALYSLGLRKFLLFDLQPVGCLPIIRALGGYHPPNICNTAINAASQAFNKQLISALTDLSHGGSAFRDAHITVFDTYSAVLQVVLHPNRYGFADTFACCGAPAPLNALVFCGTSQEIDGTLLSATVCPDRPRHIYWDFVHYTQRFAQLLTDFLVSRKFTIEL